MSFKLIYKRGTICAIACIAIAALCSGLILGSCGGQGSPSSNSSFNVSTSDNTSYVAANGFSYQHDPRNNPGAMADIIVNPEAVYGFSPRSGGSLAEYAQADWTDPSFVESSRQKHIKFHEDVAEIQRLADAMKIAGATTEEIARTVSTKRNEIRLQSYADDPEGLARLKARNLEKYGNENGETPEGYFEKTGS